MSEYWTCMQLMSMVGVRQNCVSEVRGILAVLTRRVNLRVQLGTFIACTSGHKMLKFVRRQEHNNYFDPYQTLHASSANISLPG